MPVSRHAVLFSNVRATGESLYAYSQLRKIPMVMSGGTWSRCLEMSLISVRDGGYIVIPEAPKLRRAAVSQSLDSRGGVGAPSNEECLCHFIRSPANGRTGHRRNDSGLQATEISSPAFSLVYNLRRLHQPRDVSELHIRRVSSCL